VSPDKGNIFQNFMDFQLKIFHLQLNLSQFLRWPFHSQSKMSQRPRRIAFLQLKMPHLHM